VQRREAVQQIKTAGANSFRIPEASHVAQHSKLFEGEAAGLAMKIAVNGPSLLCRIGPVAFFMKPFDDEKFIAAVRDALNQSLSRK